MLARTRLAEQFAPTNLRQSIAALAAFAVCYGVLTDIGYGLREQHGALTIVWPSAGLLYITLSLLPIRRWIWVVAVQVIIELIVDFLRAPQFKPMWSPIFAVADSLDAVVGAMITQYFVTAAALPRIRQVVIFIAAVACGAGVSASIGALGASQVLTDSNFLRQWQIWWAGNFLGALTIAPVVLTWAVRWRLPDISVMRPRSIELLTIGLALLGMTVWIFSAPPSSILNILQLPFTLLALLVVAAFRLPPRWATTFAAAVVLLAAWFASQGLGPFAVDANAFARVGSLQIFLATLATFTFMLSTVLLERQRGVDQLALSEQRYRSFVEHSSEAVWRVELSEPLPMGLSTADQIHWLQRHASVAECNLGYRRLEHLHASRPADATAWRADVPWSAVYLDQLQVASKQGFSMEGLRFTLTSGPIRKSYLANFNAVVEDGRLVRIWGVARDVTDLLDLTERLRREQQRLQLYARQLAGAEERARRATAVDLHDGIGQLLIGLSMNIAAADAHAPLAVKALLDEMRVIVRDIQESTKRLIADLSPPGLYELGLVPALQWLAVYMRKRDQLQVALNIKVEEGDLDLETRVFIFKVIRELLRNVVKHARVNSAIVNVEQSGSKIKVEVIDRGVGFEWQLDLFTDQSRGFGLFSILDRVESVNGEIAVAAAPGKGCHVSISIPLAPLVRASAASSTAG